MRGYIRESGFKCDSKQDAASQILVHCNAVMTERNEIFLDRNSHRERAAAAQKTIEKLEAKLKESDKRSQDVQQLERVNASRAMERTFDLQQGEFSKTIQQLEFSHAEALRECRFHFEEERARDRAEMTARETSYDETLRDTVHRLKKAHADELDRTLAQVASERNKTREEHSGAMKKLREEALERLAEFIVDGEERRRELSERVEELESDLLSQVDTFRPATDDILRSKFNGLASLVLRVAVTLEPLVARHSHFKRLDPYNVVSPLGVSPLGVKRLRILLQSLIWETITAAFFSLPFGFGYLGSGPGRDTLLDMKVSWERLFAPVRNGPGESCRLDKHLTRQRRLTSRSDFEGRFHRI